LIECLDKIPTSFVSILTHNKHKSVDFGIIKSYGIFVMTGVISGTILAATLETSSLVLFFAIIVYLLGGYLMFLKEKTDDIKINFGFFPKLICGFISGFISAPMGIGGDFAKFCGLLRMYELYHFEYCLTIFIKFCENPAA
jgi:uncharacterized membrane protein YfcA